MFISCARLDVNDYALVVVNVDVQCSLTLVQFFPFSNPAGCPLGGLFLFP